jgi:transcriptional regulator with XRE-family HTH domain
MTDTDLQIREAAKEALKERFGTESELARAMGVSRSHINQVLSGARGTIPQSLIDVLDALNLELYVREKPQAANDQMH